jgi:uncharacterized protein YndB with AHSA1/START domain
METIMKKNVKVTTKMAIPLLMAGLMSLYAGQGRAQMSMGRMVEYAVEKKVTVDAPLDKVWDSLSNLQSLPKYAGGYITAVVREGNTKAYSFTMQDGAVVKGQLDYLEPHSDNRFCIITLAAPLPDSIQNIEWLLTVKYAPDGKGVVVRWAAVIEGGRDGAKDRLKLHLGEMFDAYLKGLAGYFPVRQN